MCYHSSWQNCWSSATFVGFLAQTCSFSTVTCSMGFKSGLWEDHSKTSILVWFSHSFTTSDVCLGSLSCWNTRVHPTTNLLLMISSFTVLRLERGLLSTWQSLSSWWYKTHLTTDTNNRLPAASNSLQTTLSSRCFFHDHKQWHTCTIHYGTCSCFQMAPSDFPDLIKPIITILVCVAESNGCIRQALLKLSQRSHKLLSIRITQKKLIGCATNNLIHTTFYNHQNWLFKLLFVQFLIQQIWSYYQKTHNKWIERNFMTVFVTK